ncbi:MAG: ABC transporter ATP-binding protein [Anaerolineae bacterium]
MPVLEMRSVTKRFGDLTANDHIDLVIEPNEIHALLGENGAGKSTLMKILYGLYQPDEGEIIVNRQKSVFKSPVDAIRHGIGFVSQHFSLVPTFTVAENVVLGFEDSRLINRDDIKHLVSNTARKYGFDVDPTAVVRNLSVGQQQRVEILKALYRNCRVLILDEPTAVLTPRDAEALFDTLRALQRQNLSVIIITHKLEEVMAISQRVTVLRLGKVVGQETTSQTNPQALARLMMGRSVVNVTRKTVHQAEQLVALEVSHLTVNDNRGLPALRDVSFQVHANEVVGIAGVAGNGQSELVAILSGLIRPASGEVRVKGKPAAFGDPRALDHLRVARIPEDRLKGVVGNLTVAENLALEQIGNFTQTGHLKRRQIDEMAKWLIADFQIKAKPGDRVRTLSGGNIQKVILARTLSREPHVVIAAQPTRGLDIGATEYVHQKLLEQKERGAGVLLVSEDLDETLLLSDRVLVMFAGQLVGEYRADEVDLDRISLLMAGSTVETVSR